MLKSKGNRILLVIILLALLSIIGMALKSKSRVKELGVELLSVESINNLTSSRNGSISGIVNLGPGLYKIFGLIT